MAICGRCGEHNPTRARFCLGCGTALAGSGADTRKIVTILFADMVDSTGLGEQMDPEAYRSLISRYFDSMQATIETHGGSVERFIGDAMMAVFGIPRVHEDDALRAVRGAVALQAGIARLNEELSNDYPSISVRVGINTGEVITESGKEGRSAVVGDPVNAAARLEKLAPPGGIVIGGPTYRLVRDVVDCEAMGHVSLKGRSEPIDTYKVLTVGPVSRHDRVLDAPMVGRSRELDALHRAYQRATEDAACTLFTILGSAGVGKSRLVAEFVKSAVGIPRVLTGRCLPYGDGITFWPIAEAVIEAAHISDRDSQEDALAKLRSLVESNEDSKLIANLIGQLLGLGDVTASQEEIFWAVRKTFETLASQGPLVVAFDDIHWAEGTFLDLIDHIVETSEAIPMFVLCLARPELLELRSAWGGGKPNSSTMLLEPLREAQTKELLSGLLGDTTALDPLMPQILERSEGNPFFLEETIAMLVEDRIIENVDGQWIAGGDVSDITIPPTINALLTARLDQLPWEERATLDLASVMGKVFALVAVRDLATSEMDARDALESLTRKGLLRRAQEEFGGDEMYSFRHLLIRDTAYQAIPKERRATVHEQFADWLVEVLGERVAEYDEIIGYHLEQSFAYRTELGSTPDLVEATRNKAADRLASAGRRAYLRGDYAATISLLSRAAELARPDGRDLPIRIELSEALIDAGNYPESKTMLTETIERARQAGEEGLETLASIHLENVLAKTEPNRPLDAMHRAVDRAIRTLDRLDDPAGLSYAYRFLAYLYDTVGKSSLSQQSLREAILHAERAGDERRTNHLRRVLLVSISWGPIHLTDLKTEAESFLKEVRASGDLRSQARALSILGMVHALQGDPVSGRDFIAQQKEIHDKLGLPVHKAWLCFESLWVELAAGDLERAEKELRAAVETLDRYEERAVLPTVLAMLADIRCTRGDLEEAEQLLMRAREMAADDDVLTQIKWRTVLARIYARRGGGEDGISLAREATALAEPTEYLEWQANAWMDLAEISRKQGRIEAACAALTEAIDRYERKGMTVMVDRARAELSSLKESH